MSEQKFQCITTSCQMSAMQFDFSLEQAQTTQMRCPACQGELADVASRSLATTQWLNDLHPKELPMWLAHPWASYCEDNHPRVRLHWLCDTAELVVRWTVAVALAEVVHAHDGVIPNDVARAILEHVERPTLGRWLAILRALCKATPKQLIATQDLNRWVSSTLEPAFQTEQHGGTITSSLLVLRNQVAHGGGMTRAKAETLVAQHEPTLIDLLEGVKATIAGSRVVADGLALMGLSPQPVEEASDAKDKSGAWLVSDRGALPLEPLAHYGPIKHVGADGAEHEQGQSASPQFYARGGKDRLSYTPLGQDEAHSEQINVEHFRALFQLDTLQPTRKPSTGGFAWDDFLRECRSLAEDLIGRRTEIDTAKAWLKSRDPYAEETARLGWISAGPGVGKSMLMARLAADYGNGNDRGLYIHRFRGGDARNNRRSFLRLLQGALWCWAPLAAITEEPTAEVSEGSALEDDVKARLERVALLDPAPPRAPRPQFWVFLDGLDEVVSSDPGIPDLVRSLALPGTVWLAAGRPEHDLNTRFDAPGCAAIFEGGLPSMHADDIRAMLLEGLGNARYALLARDEDTPVGVHNTFINAVVSRANGLPIYVHLLLEDLRQGHLSINDEARLPHGLTAYYDDLVDRLGVSDAKADLTHIVALLSQSMEPIDVAGLALLLAPEQRHLTLYTSRVQAALRVGSALLRQAPSRDTDDGWTLYHQSFKEYVSTAPALASSVALYRDKLAKAACEWAQHTSEPLQPIRKHLFRWGTEYALWWLKPNQEGVEDAQTRLTDFEYLQVRTEALAAYECTDLAAEYESVLEQLSAGDNQEHFSIWEAFFRERAHILRRGEDSWPSNRILLQLAIEHADASPITQAAERWLNNTEQCYWLWLRSTRRPEHANISPCIRVFEGHTEWINGTRVLDDGRILSWSDDGTLRLWDSATGTSLTTLEGHTNSVNGTRVLDDGRILSWSDDNTLRLWDSATGTCLATLEGHTDSINGARVLDDGRILSWSDDNTLRLWDSATGTCLTTLEGHTNRVWGTRVLDDGRILSWSRDKTLRLWDSATGTCLTTLEGHTDWIMGTRVLDDGRILSWSHDGTLRLWDSATGTCLATLEGHTNGVKDIRVLDDGRILSWSHDGTLRLWDSATGTCLTTLEGHTDSINGTRVLDDGRILSWSHDGTLRLWDSATGTCLKTLEGHTEVVNGTRVLNDGRIFSWSRDKTLRLWDSATGTCLTTLEGHTYWIMGTRVLDDGRILSWSNDGTLRLWDSATGTCLTTLEGHTDWIMGTRVLDDGRILSWSRDKTLRLWDSATGTSLTTIEGHTNLVNGTRVLDDGRILSWSDDGTLRLWDSATGTCLTTLEGHTDWIMGTRVLDDGRILSWSNDNTLRLWDSATGTCLTTLEGHTDWIMGTRVLDDGRILSWSHDGTLRLWDSATGTCLTTLEGHTNRVWGTRVLDDGRILSWSHDGTLRLWDSATGTCLTTLEGHTDSINGTRVLDDGRILSWSRDKTLRLWDSATGTCLKTLEGHTEVVNGTRVLNDGRIFSWSRDKTLRLWDSATGTCLTTLEGHTDWIMGTRVLDDGRILSWSNDGTLRLWDSATGTCLKTLEGHTEVVNGTRVLNDGRIFSWSNDNTLRLWDSATGENLRTVTDAATAGDLQSHADMYLNRADEEKTIGDHVAVTHRGGVALVHQNAVALWHGDGEWRSDSIDKAGIITSRCSSDLRFVQLYQGSEPITLSALSATT